MNLQTLSMRHPMMSDAKDLITLILRNEDFLWPADEAFAAGFLHFCKQEGLAGLVFKALKDSGKLAGTPTPIRRALLGAQMAGERIHEIVDTELAKVLQKLSVQGIQALLFKGCALAHVLYPEPWLRLACDSDILIRAGDRDIVEKALLELGYERQNAISGDLLMKQAGYLRISQNFRVFLDIQWDYSQAQVLSGLLIFDDLYAKSLQVPRISPYARTFSKVDSLILACAHWIGHMTYRKLVWLFDIHMLVESLTEAEQVDFCRTAEHKRVCALCHHTLRQARECFGTRIPAQIDADLKGVEFEPSARLLKERSRSGRIWGDLLAARGCRNKLQLVCEHLFPPADYMRTRYGHSGQLLLPFLYLHRALKGVARITRC